MGTNPEIPSPSFGSATGRYRVLVGAGEWTRATGVSHGLEREGFEVVSCGGPEGHDLRCPYVGGEGCPAIDQADAAVFMLRLTDVRNLELLGRLRKDRPDLPLVVATPGPLAERHADLLTGTTVLDWTATPAEVAKAVSQAPGALVTSRVTR